MRRLALFILVAAVQVFSLRAAAQSLPYDFTVEGRLYDNAGTPLSTLTGYLRLELLSEQNPACVLFREDFPPIDLTSTNATAVGVFSLRLGSGSKVFPVTAISLPDFFKPGTFNGVSNDLTVSDCVTTATATHHPLVRIRFKTSGGGSFETLSPDTRVTAVPSAMVADSANTLQGKDATRFLLTNTSSALVQTNVESVFSTINYTKLNNLLNGTSTQYQPTTPTAPVNTNGQRIVNIADPTGAQDAATKNYSDSNMGGKTIDSAGIGLGVGGGKTLVWDQVLNKWVAQDPSAGLTSLVAGSGLLGGTITSSGTLSVDTGTTGNKIVQLASGKLPAVDASFLTNIQFPITSVAGRTGAVTLNAVDISGLGTAAVKDYGLAAGNLVELASASKLPALDGSLLSNINASYISSRSVASAAPASGQVLTWNGSQWEPQTPVAAGITALTGDVTAAGPGVAAATISANAVTSAKINSIGNVVNRLLITDASTGATVTYATCLQGEVMKYDVTTGWGCAADAGASGSVTVVAAGIGLVAGTITSSGTLNIDVGVTASKILQLNGSAQIPAVDGFLITNINAVKLQSRNLASTAPSPGQVIGWTGAQWEPISVTSGTLTQIVASTGLLGGTINSNGTVSVDVGVTANKIVQLDGSARLPAVDGSLLTSINADSLRGLPVASSLPSTNQVLTWNGSQWIPMAVAVVSFPLLASPVGSAGAPAYSFTGDATTGMYDVGVGTLGFATGGSNRMLIDSSGNVGVGTSNPTSILDVLSSSAITSNFANSAASGTAVRAIASGTSMAIAVSGQVTNGGINSAGVYGSNTTIGKGVWGTSTLGTSGYFQSSAAGNSAATLVTKQFGSGSADLFLAMNASGATLFNISSTGLVGIGTTSPQAVLDVNGTGTALSAMIVPRDTTALRPGGVNGMIRYNTTTAKFEAYEGAAWVNMTASGSSGFVNGGNSFGNNAILGTSDNYKLTLITNGGPRLTLDGLGNVGIGTTNPYYPLHVFDQNDNIGLQVEAPSIAKMRLLRAGSTGAEISAAASGDTRVDAGLNGTDIFIGGATGLVGIGTIAPQAILDVRGTGTLQSALIVPRDSSGNRPWGAGAVDGMMRYNTTTIRFEVLEGGTWNAITRGALNTADPIYASDGSAAAPSHSFSSGTAMGMYRSGADILGFSTAGSARMTISSSGNVGIGNTSPQATLDVSGTATFNGQFDVVSPSTTTTAINLAVSGTNGGISLVPNGSGVVTIGGTTPTIRGSTSGLTLQVTGGAGGITISPGASTGAVTIGNSSNGATTIGNTGGAAATTIQSGAGKVKLGSTGTGFTAMGTCAVATTIYSANTPLSSACTGVPASSTVVVSCSPQAALSVPGTWSARATGTLNQVAITTSSTVTTVAFTCMWIQP